MSDTPKTKKAVTSRFQTGPTNEYKVYASVCEQIERELNEANHRIWELKCDIRINQATIASLQNTIKGLSK